MSTVAGLLRSSCNLSSQDDSVRLALVLSRLPAAPGLAYAAQGLSQKKPLRRAAIAMFLLPTAAPETEPNAWATAIVTVAGATTVIPGAPAVVAIASTGIIAVVIAIASLNIAGATNSVAASVFVAHQPDLIDLRSLRRLDASGVHRSRNRSCGQQGSCSKNRKYNFFHGLLLCQSYKLAPSAMASARPPVVMSSSARPTIMMTSAASSPAMTAAVTAFDENNAIVSCNRRRSVAYRHCRSRRSYSEKANRIPQQGTGVSYVFPSNK